MNGIGIRRLFLQLYHSPGSSAGVARGQPRAIPHLVGSRLASPYHFRARIQSFQTVAAPFPGDSVLPVRPSRAAVATIETPRFKRPTIVSAVSPGDGGTGTDIERLRNSGKKFVERVGSCAPSDPRVVIVACKRAPNFYGLRRGRP
jgi:hypothetical protein